MSMEPIVDLSTPNNSKGVIFGLVRGYEALSSYSWLINRNRAIYKLINSKCKVQYPLIIFHEGNIKISHQEYIISEAQGQDLRFIDISDSFIYPENINISDLLEDWQDGYRFMCRFHSKYVFDYLSGFDFGMRVDEDCILEDVPRDPFDWLIQTGKVFASVAYGPETHVLTNETMPSGIEAALKDSELPVPPRQTWWGRAAYTNIYVTDLSFWNRPDVSRFLDNLVSNSSFLTHRWGDAPVIGSAVEIFLSASEIGRLPLRYHHGSHAITVSTVEAPVPDSGLPSLPLNLGQFGRKRFSQNDEDGIIEAIFSYISPKSRFFVEFGIGPNGNDPNYLNNLEGNCVELRQKGWNGVFWDGGLHPPAFDVKKEFITALNINDLCTKYDVPDDIDVISIDVDGQEFWIWLALQLNPALVIVEYNSSFEEAEDSFTVPFKLDWVWDGSCYQGSSAGALIKLGESKGYQLVYANPVNLFFLRKNLFLNHDEFDSHKLIWLSYKLHRGRLYEYKWVKV